MTNSLDYLNSKEYNDNLLKKSKGNIESFISSYTGLPKESKIVKNYSKDIKSRLK